MSQSFLQMADRSKLAADDRSATIAGVVHTLKRQQLVAVPGNAAEVQGVDPGEVLVEVLANGVVVNAAVNAGGAAQAFTYTVPEGKTLLLDQVGLTIADSGAWTAAVLGALGAALANGLRIDVVETDETVLAPILPVAKTTAELVSAPGAAAAMVMADLLHVDLDARAEGWPIKVTAGRKVRLQVHDDLTGLTLVRATVRGRLL